MFDTFKQIRKLLESLAQDKADAGADNSALYEAEIAYPYYNPSFDYRAGNISRTRDTGQLIKCIQGYNAVEHPNVTPDSKAHWMHLHGTDADHAYPFEHPTMAEDIYRKGEWMTFDDGFKYEALRDTAYSPTENPADWLKHE